MTSQLSGYMLVAANEDRNRREAMRRYVELGAQHDSDDRFAGIMILILTAAFVIFEVLK